MANPLEAQIDAEMAPPGSAPIAAAAPAADPVGASIDEEMLQSQYGTPGQTALAAAEAFAKGFAGPVATGAEKALTEAGFPGLSPEKQAAREKAHPILHPAAEVAGFGVGMLAGTGEARVLAKAGELAIPAAEALGIGGKGAGLLGKIGSASVRGAVENGLYQSGDEISRYINDPKSVESAIPHIGLAAMIGGGAGGLGGAVSTLWRTTAGSKAGSLLEAIAKRAGGIEGAESEPLGELVSKTGLQMPPELQSAASQDPVLRRWASTLNQTDTSNSGREFQQTLKDFHEQAGDTVAQTLGRETKEIPDEFDKYTHGKNIGTTLADEVNARVSPLKSAYEDYSNKYKGKDLLPSVSERTEESRAAIEKATTQFETLNAEAAQAGGHPQATELAARANEAKQTLESVRRDAAVPGTVDVLQQKIGQLAQDEKWSLSPSSDIMKEVTRIQKELPNLKTLDDLSAYIQRVGENMQNDPLNGPMNRAAGKLKGILRDTEGELIGSHVGSEEGVDSLEHYRATQKAYGAESALKDELASRLGKLGATASYGARIKEMAQSDGEAVFRKLSGKDDADLLRLLSEKFPKTAEAVRAAHLDQVLSKAKLPAGGLNATRAIGELNKLSPQLRHFVVGPEATGRLDAMETILGKLKDTSFNYSSTGRTLDKLLEYIPGSAVGMVSMLLAHNPAIGFAVGALTKYISKDAPDAVRLGLLKWLGSNKPIEAGAFKSMVDVIHATMKGDSLTANAAKALFSGATKVIPEHLMVDDRSIEHLDKKLKTIQNTATPLEDTGHLPGYYLPNHGANMTAVATNAAQYLNSLRPNTEKPAPLDEDLEPSDLDNMRFRRALEIAEQPLTVMHSLKEGQLTSEDVSHLRTLYPEFYNRLNQKVTEAMVKHTARGDTIPYDLRFGLSTLMGQPLDSSLSPMNVLSNQSQFIQAQQAAQGKKSNPSQVGMRAMKVSNRLSLSHMNEET